MSLDVDLRKILKTVGLDYFHKYYGDYNGQVADNKDPDKLGRIKVKVPAIYGDQVHNFWASPKGLANGANEGIFWIPKVDDYVSVTFDNGNCRFPRWQHAHWGTKDDMGNSVLAGLYDDDGTPTKRQITTSAGQSLIFDDKNKLIDIVDVNGQHIKMNADGVAIIGDTLIALGDISATHPAILGDMEQSLWNKILSKLAMTTAAGSPLSTAADFTLMITEDVPTITSTLVKLKN